VDGVVSDAISTGRAMPAADVRREIEVLAVSDDLTGAAALAGEFHAGGLASEVARTARAKGGGNVESLVVDTRSRRMEAAAAARVVSGVLRDHDLEPRSYFKRVDSALRGNVAAELDAMARILGRPFVLATAAPALGVPTRGGTQRSAGGGTRLADLVGAGAMTIALEELRDASFPGLLAGAVASGRDVICDGEAEADLARVAAALAPHAERAVPVGTYGFGRHWATAMAGLARPGAGILVVVGSLQPASRRQVELVRTRGVGAIFDAAKGRLDPAAAVDRGDDVILVAAPEAEDARLSPDPAVGDRLARRAVGLAATHAYSGIVLVGGELASAFFEHAGADAGRVVVEPWPAAPVLRLHGGSLDGTLVLTKSGAQGDEGWLDRALVVMRGLGHPGAGAIDA
jgi:4-hydroxythreonine-4-phosphate dehydrogenase